MSNAVKQFSIHINNLKANDVKEFYQVLEEKYATYFRKHTPNDYYLSMINLQNFNNKKVYQPKPFTPRPFELIYTLTLAHCSYNLLDYIIKVLSEGLGIDILLKNQPVPFEIPKFTSNLDHKANSSTSKNKSLSSNSQPVFNLTTTTTPVKFQSLGQHTAYLVFQEVLHWCNASDDFSLYSLIHYLPSGLSKINNMQNYIANMCQVYHKYWLGPDIDRIFSEKYPEIFSSRLQKIIDIQSTDSESQTQISNTIIPNTTVQKTDINSKLNKEQQYYKDFPFLLTSNVLTYWLLLSGTAYQTPYHVTHTQEGKTGLPLKIIEILSSIPFEHFSMLFYQMHDIAYSRPDIDKSFASKVTFHAFRAPYMFTIKNREKNISVLTGNFYAGNGHYLPEHQFLDIQHFYNGKDLVGYYCPYINSTAMITEDLFLTLRPF